MRTEGAQLAVGATTVAFLTFLTMRNSTQFRYVVIDCGNDLFRLLSQKVLWRLPVSEIDLLAESR